MSNVTQAWLPLTLPKPIIFTPDLTLPILTYPFEMELNLSLPYPAQFDLRELPPINSCQT